MAYAAYNFTLDVGSVFAKEIADGINAAQKYIAAIKAKKEATRKILAESNVEDLAQALNNCTEIASQSRLLQDSLQAMICKVKAGKLKANLSKLEAASKANVAFMNQLGPALAACQNQPSWQEWAEKPCNGPCLGVWEVRYAADSSCVTKLKKAFNVSVQNVYDFAKQITIDYGKWVEAANTPTKLQKNACGEYLMYTKTVPSMSGAGVATYLVPPTGKKAISSFFKNDIEYYQYLILRTFYGDKVGCRNFKLAEYTYVDEGFLMRRESLLLFLSSGLTSANAPVLAQAGVRTAEQYQQFKLAVVSDLFDESKNQQAQVQWIEYVNRAINTRTMGELMGMIPFEAYVGAAKFSTNAVNTAAKSPIIAKFVRWVRGVNTAGNIGTYTTKIKWGILDVDARPFGDKGYWGKRIAQNDPRVEAFELKVNPNNESFYVEHPSGGFVQFENLNANALQDGKMVLQPNNSMYKVYDKPEFLRQKVLDEAIRQTQAANAKGLTVEWLVSDQTAVNQLRIFFGEKNVNITVKFLAE